MNILEIKNLKKSFGKTQVLKNINFSIKQGEKVAILGPNGSGKSTLINIILGLLKQDSGEVNYPFYKNNIKNFTSNTGVQFQSGDFPQNFKVNEIIKIALEQNSKFKYKNYFKWSKLNFKKVEKFLKIFKISNLKNFKIKYLSGGEKQRLNILLALISKPKILILDEISTGLDIGSQQKLIKFIDDYVKKHKVTLIIISHIVFEIENLVNDILMLDKGIIVFRKSKSELIKKFGSLGQALKKYFIDGKEGL